MQWLRNLFSSWFSPRPENALQAMAEIRATKQKQASNWQALAQDFEARVWSPKERKRLWRRQASRDHLQEGVWPPRSPTEQDERSLKRILADLDRNS